jgi:hypothetical protein
MARKRQRTQDIREQPIECRRTFGRGISIAFSQTDEMTGMASTTFTIAACGPNKRLEAVMSSIRAMTVVLPLAGAVAMNAAVSAAERTRFTAHLQTTSRLIALDKVDPNRCADEPGQMPVIGVLEVRGAGDADLLGPVIDEQSHCVRSDFTFFAGRFRLTNAAGRFIEGRYSGQLEPVFEPAATDARPGPQFLIRGSVCIEGGTVARIQNDCERHRFQPARGITNIVSGDATIFLDQLIGLVEGQ